MKKKFREITVDGELYAWAVKDTGEGHNTVSIWKDKKLIYVDAFPAAAQITPEMITTIIQRANKQHHLDPMEVVYDTIREHNVLKKLMLTDNEERKKAGYAPRKNAIIEAHVGNDEEPRLFAARINIDGMEEFDLPDENAIGNIRQVSKDRIKNPRHPLNIERITFLVNGEEVEFARCQD